MHGMYAIRKKLNDSGGASMLMALLLLLLAMMVSIVLLTAAVSSAKTIRNEREQQQAYLTVSSAVALVRDSVLGGSGSYTVTTKTIYKKSNYTDLYGSPTKESEDASGNFSSILNEAIEKVMNDPESTYTSACSIQDADGRYAEVRADFTLSAEESEADADTYYILTVACSIADPGEHPCRMTLTMRGQEKSKTTENTLEGYITEYYYDWRGRKRLQKVDAYQRTTETSIDWSATTPEISRERVSAE